MTISNLEMGSRSYPELKCLSRSSSSVVHLCECPGTTPTDNIPQSYFESAQRQFRNHPEWRGKRILVSKRRRFTGTAECAEVEVLTQARTHPHVITLFHAFVEPSASELYMLFEHMEGNLAQLIKSRKQRYIPEGLIHSITAQIASALECVHALGIAHRSLSPDHVLITTTGLVDYPPYPPSTRPRKDVTVEVKIAGFGHSIKVPSIPVASPFEPIITAYTPPEVLFGETDERLYAADIWSLGCICAELAFLRPLFEPHGRRQLFREWCSALGPPQSPLVLGSKVDGQYSPAAVSWAESFGIDLTIFTQRSILLGTPNLSTDLVQSMSEMLQWNWELRPCAAAVAASYTNTGQGVVAQAEARRPMSQSRTRDDYEMRRSTAGPSLRRAASQMEWNNWSSASSSRSQRPSTSTARPPPSYGSLFELNQRVVETTRPQSSQTAARAPQDRSDWSQAGLGNAAQLKTGIGGGGFGRMI